MEQDDELKSKSGDEIEAWFVEQLQQPVVATARLVSVLGWFGEQDATRSGVLADLLLDALRERKDRDGTLAVLEFLAGRRGEDPGFRGVCATVLSAVFQDRSGSAFLDGAGLSSGVPVRECLRRLGVLTGVREGSACYEKTWGFGVVSRVDDFYRRVTVDFLKKPGHPMSFAYFAESVELIPETHILVQQHRNRKGLEEMAAQRPGEVVKMALHSFGPVTAARLKELLADVVPDASWKTFWDSARSALKRDPVVSLPGGRNETIRLRDAGADPAAERRAALRDERDPAQVLDLISAVWADRKRREEDGSLREQVAQKLAFVARAGDSRKPGFAGRALVLSEEIGVPIPGFPAESERERLTADSATLVRAFWQMGARDIGAFLELWVAKRPAQAVERMLQILPEVSAPALTEIVGRLTAMGQEGACGERIHGLVESREAGYDLLSWLCRNLQTAGVRGHIGGGEVLAAALDLLADIPRAGRSRGRSLLESTVQDRQWLAGLVEGLGPAERDALLWKAEARTESAAKRVVLARLAELGMTTKAGGGAAAEEGRASVSRRYTSWRTYRQRQEQLRALVETEMPRNSRDLAQARSYGDLSENYEFKAAKEQQRILLRRRDEWKQDLDEVRPTDFAEARSDRAGMGTCVTVRRAGGRTERYCILGEWDRDEGLGIVSNGSRVAAMLEGHAAGDDVVLPGADAGGAGETCRIESVGPLPEDVRAWVSGGASGAAAGRPENPQGGC